MYTIIYYPFLKDCYLYENNLQMKCKLYLHLISITKIQLFNILLVYRSLRIYVCACMKKNDDQVNLRCFSPIGCRMKNIP
jgi:hypothetical protein